MSEALNLHLFFFAIARVALLCGLAPAIAFAVFYEQVSGRAVSHDTSIAHREGNKPARNDSPEILRRAA